MRRFIKVYLFSVLKYYENLSPKGLRGFSADPRRGVSRDVIATLVRIKPSPVHVRSAESSRLPTDIAVKDRAIAFSPIRVVVLKKTKTNKHREF